MDRSDIIATKEALDSFIKKQRAHLYKPIQVAEILYRVRQGELNIDDLQYNLESYRNLSKRWRDSISRLLVDRVSTSSQRYQDNLFDPNAVPPEMLAVLAQANENGVVERYIYQKFWEKQQLVIGLVEMLQNATRADFYLEAFLSRFGHEPGMKRSIDKAYEMVAYALFNTLVEHLRVRVTVSADSSQLDLLQAFDDFARLVLGIDSQNPELVLKARLYRAGVTNAADRGLDMWANFGSVVQVKHLTFTEELAEDICEHVMADRIVIVCKDGEEDIIGRICQQLGQGQRIQGIIVQSQLTKWYEKALRGEFADRLGDTLLRSLYQEFLNEFPYSQTFRSFYEERGYDQVPETSSPFWCAD